MRSDASAVDRLARQSANYLRDLGDTTDFKFNAEIYLRDGFGSNPAFSGIVAVDEEEVVGYVLYHFGYDTDRALRLMYVVDLIVDEDRRNSGIGKALMLRAADIARDASAAELFWAVYKPNTSATKFYKRLGAELIDDLDFMRWSVHT